MFDRIKALLQRIDKAREVDALTDYDLDDLGMTRAQVHDFLRMPQDITQRVTAMGAIFGVPEADLKRDHGQWVDLLSTCAHCADRGACARVLALGDLAHPDQAHFCDNRASFADLAARVAWRRNPLRSPSRAALMHGAYGCVTPGQRAGRA